ncbi:MAG TPA: GLUG motif-containing protein, partial [Candidatus Babeliales bacterium]|nr:GLUG motif-containing protein [Candidatus Babeliales bacterium]
VNEGQIIAAEHGLVALIGGAVRNDGMIQAELGHAVLASGESFTMTFAGDDLIGFSVDTGVSKRAVDRNGNELSDGVNNTGSIYADGGRILISANAAAGVLDRVVNTEGLVRARSVSKSGGTIEFSASPQSGVVRIASKVDASGKGAGEKGGNITVTGENILLDNTALLDVSGDIGGGNINIGGNYQGLGPLPHANAVVMAPGAKIYADALTSGDGGRVILWSDYYTNVSGLISARGGSEAGNGGLIETSSKNHLSVGDILVDTTAANGNAGNWLLDPADLTISTDSNSNVSGTSPFQPTAATSILNVGTLTTALGTGNVTVQTANDGFSGNGDLTVASAISWSSAFTLTLTAYNKLFLNADITAASGGLTLNAANLTQSITSGTSASPSATGVTANINVANFNLAQGQWYQVNASLPIFTVSNNFRINSGNGPASSTARFIRATSGSGSGPYNITDVYGLQGIGSNTTTLGYSYTLGNNIDATSTLNWNSGTGFYPIGAAIGAATTYFTGSFNGNNYTINNLYINLANTAANATSDIDVGLFSSLGATGTISNVGLTNINVSYSTTVTGIPALSRQTGGLVGINWGGSISNSYTSGSVSFNTISGLNFSSLGGLVGYNLGSITNSYNLANVTKTGSASIESTVGGLSGNNWRPSGVASISNSYNAGNVTATYSADAVLLVGGLLGRNTLSSGTSSTVTNSYNVGTVTALGSPANSTNFSVGGLVGANRSGTISTSYSSCVVSATSNYYTGGFIGAVSGGTLTNNYFDTQTSGRSGALGA